MGQRFFYAGVVLLIGLIALVSAAPAVAGRNCDAAKETIETDFKDWIEFSDKIKPLVEEHSKNNFEIINMEVEIMTLRIKAISATSDEDRRALIDQYKTLEQKLEGMDRDEPRKTYYQDWEQLMDDKKALQTAINDFINACPIDPDTRPPE